MISFFSTSSSFFQLASMFMLIFSAVAGIGLAYGQDDGTVVSDEKEI